MATSFAWHPEAETEIYLHQSEKVTNRKGILQMKADKQKERLKFILDYDRSGLSPGLVAMMRRDIASVLSKYLRIKPEEVESVMELTFIEEAEEKLSAINANVPMDSVSGSRRNWQR